MRSGLRRAARRDDAVQRLREQWRQRSAAAGWSFPTDWYTPAVDALCEALCWQTDMTRPAARRLGGQRALAGVPLAEALVDIDELARLVPAAQGENVRRAMSLGWADRIAVSAEAVLDPITGLASRDYLLVRLGEVYRAPRPDGAAVGATQALVVARMEHRHPSSLLDELPIIAVAEQLRAVFAGGETLVQAGPAVLLALVTRDDMLPRRVQLLGQLIDSALDSPDGRGITPRLWIEPLPAHYAAACDLVGSLRR